MAAGYDVKWAREWIQRDTAVYRALGQDNLTAAGIFAANLLDFVG